MAKWKIYNFVKSRWHSKRNKIKHFFPQNNVTSFVWEWTRYLYGLRALNWSLLPWLIVIPSLADFKKQQIRMSEWVNRIVPWQIWNKLICWKKKICFQFYFTPFYVNHLLKTPVKNSWMNFPQFSVMYEKWVMPLKTLLALWFWSSFKHFQITHFITIVMERFSLAQEFNTFPSYIS